MKVVDMGFQPGFYYGAVFKIIRCQLIFGSGWKQADRDIKSN